MIIQDPIAKIENKLFQVVEHQLIPSTNDADFLNPTVRGLYKHTGGAPLGVVGSNFNVTQPKALFDAFIECFGTFKNLDVNTIHYQETKGGSKVRFRVLVDSFSFVNGADTIDDNETYATLTTGFDGLTKTSLSLETMRLICTNGMRVKSTIANVAVKNVKGNQGKIGSICSTMAKVVGKTNDVQEWAKYLNGIDIKEIHIQKVIKETFGYNRADKDELSGGRLATLEDIESRIALEIDRSGGNFWGLLNGITNYTNHGGRAKEDRTDYIYQSGGATINDKAQKAIAELIS